MCFVPFLILVTVAVAVYSHVGDGRWSGRGGGMLIESSKTYPYPRGLAGQEIVDVFGLNGPS